MAWVGMASWSSAYILKFPDIGFYQQAHSNRTWHKAEFKVGIQCHSLTRDMDPRNSPVTLAFSILRIPQTSGNDLGSLSRKMYYLEKLVNMHLLEVIYSSPHSGKIWHRVFLDVELSLANSKIAQSQQPPLHWRQYFNPLPACFSTMKEVLLHGWNPCS